MKYFTGELWKQFQSPETYEQASLEWEKNCKTYWELFEGIKNRFSKKFLDIYFKNHGFHDFHLKNINITDCNSKKHPSIEITISEFGKTFRITYKGVKRFKINYEEDSCAGFDDWGYDEFLPEDDEHLSHEILFASESSILIQFKNKNIFIDKSNGQTE